MRLYASRFFGLYLAGLKLLYESKIYELLIMKCLQPLFYLLVGILGPDILSLTLRPRIIRARRFDRNFWFSYRGFKSAFFTDI